MSIFAEAFKKAGIQPTDFEDIPINEDEIKFDEQIKFWETWLKMLERNASDKEKHNFVIKHGFVSLNQFDLWSAITNDYQDLEMQLEEGEYMTISKRKELIKEIEQKKSMAEDIKRPSYYSLIMRELGKKDISPYGEDILKSIRNSLIHREKVWTEKDFKNCKGLLYF